MNEMTFGERLRDCRKAAGFGLRELAAKVSISPPYLSDIELGRRLPSDVVLADLAVALGSPTLQNAVIDARVAMLKKRIEEVESKRTVRAKKGRAR